MNSIELIVLAFDQADKADQALKDIKALEQSKVIRVMNAAVLANVDGKVTVKETEDVNAKHGAVFGAITGGLLGVMAGPAGAIVGAVTGTTTGGVAAHGMDMGFSNTNLNELRDALPPNSSALVLLIENHWVEKVAEDLDYLAGKLYRQALKAEVAAQFAAEAAEMDRRIAAMAEKQAAMRQELYGDITTRFQTWQTIIKALEVQIETSAADKKAELRQQVEALREKVKTDREALNKKIETQLREWQIEMVDLRTRAANATHQAKVALHQQIELLQLKQDAAWAEMQQNLAAQVEARWVDMESLKATTAVGVAEAKARLQAQLATAQTNWVSARDKLQAAIETQLQELEPYVEQDIEMVRARQAHIETRLQELRTSSRAAGQDLAGGVAKAKKDLQEAREAAVAEFK